MLGSSCVLGHSGFCLGLGLANKPSVGLVWDCWAKADQAGRILVMVGPV